MSVDGLAMIGTTLVAAAAGFLAIRYQVRSSSKHLRDQTKAQRDAEEAEQERQKKAIATAILYEIDDFHLYHVRGVYSYLEEKARMGELIEVVRIPPSLFAVYRGNTPRLAELPDAVVKVVVHFYSKADKFFALIEDYRAERERRHEPISQSDNWKGMTLFGHLRDSLPGLTHAAYIACEQLCGFSGVEFNSPRIAIAGEDIAELNRKTERIEHEDVHQL